MKNEIKPDKWDELLKSSLIEKASDNLTEKVLLRIDFAGKKPAARSYDRILMGCLATILLLLLGYSQNFSVLTFSGFSFSKLFSNVGISLEIPSYHLAPMLLWTVGGFTFLLLLDFMIRRVSFINQ